MKAEAKADLLHGANVLVSLTEQRWLLPARSSESVTVVAQLSLSPPRLPKWDVAEGNGHFRVQNGLMEIIKRGNRGLRWTSYRGDPDFGSRAARVSSA